jgi:hypothetical protein
MAMLDEEGAHYKCDRCGAEYEYDDEAHSFIFNFVHGIFRQRPHPDLPDFCQKCAKEVVPLVYALRDADELKLFVNNLERAINEKRREGNKNNRPTSDDVSQCRERCTQRRFGYRSSHSASQAGEEHF